MPCTVLAACLFFTGNFSLVEAIVCSGMMERAERLTIIVSLILIALCSTFWQLGIVLMNYLTFHVIYWKFAQSEPATFFFRVGFLESLQSIIKMARFTQVMVLSIGTLAGAAAGFYALEAYKVNEKV
jgi:hypothetical protein